MFVAGVSEQNENPGDISLAGRPRSTSCRQTASSALPLQPASKARQNRQGQGAGRVWLKQLSLRWGFQPTSCIAKSHFRF